jgi:hypothetical protein
MPQEVISLLTREAAADKIKIPKDPIFQISTLQSPALDDLTVTGPETTLIPANDNHQDLTLLDTMHIDRAPSPPPSTHRADDLPLPSVLPQTEADNGGDTPMQADDRQVEQSDDFADGPAVSEERDIPLTAESSTTTVETNSGNQQ